MGLGLIVGIAALGVIAFRTVVERRQQIGMLRAIGYSRRLVALSFFMESSFIALAGVVMGLILGTALSYNLLTSPDFTRRHRDRLQRPVDPHPRHLRHRLRRERADDDHPGPQRVTHWPSREALRAE